MRAHALVSYPTRGPNDIAPLLPGLGDLPLGALVGRARLAGVVLTENGGHRRSVPGARCDACGQDMRDRSRCPKANPWAIDGAVGLLLEDRQKLVKPIPYKGALGLFEVSDEVLVGARFEEARP
jgi:hypothetical protein